MEPTLEQAFYDDVYSRPFNILRYLGQWSLESESSLEKNLYLWYKLFVGFVGGFLSVAGLIDLYSLRTDYKKAVFNVSTSTLIVGIWIKNFHIQLHARQLDELRWNLFKDGWGQRKNPEDVEIRKWFLKIFILIRKVFYLACHSFLPIWLLSSFTTLFSGPRTLPFSIWTPVNLEDNVQFLAGFAYHTFGAIFILAETIQADFAMFSLLLQIATQYSVLAKDIRKIDEFYRARPLKDRDLGEMNKMLLKHRSEERLRECVKRQLTLKGYVKVLENAYSKPMMIQLVSGFVLTIGNGLEVIAGSMNFSVNLSYQLGYTVMIMSDVYLCCSLADLLKTEAQKVIWSFYDIEWFEMDCKTRRHLILAIMGAQKIQPLTAAKMFNLNLTTFLGILKNVYSWLALFRQLLMKK